jgi:hypothetical protein
MRNRAKQRELHRKDVAKRGIEKPWQNAEGYNDFTAYHGMQRAAKGKAPDPTRVGRS